MVHSCSSLVLKSSGVVPTTLQLRVSFAYFVGFLFRLRISSTRNTVWYQLVAVTLPIYFLPVLTYWVLHSLTSSVDDCVAGVTGYIVNLTGSDCCSMGLWDHSVKVLLAHAAGASCSFGYSRRNVVCTAVIEDSAIQHFYSLLETSFRIRIETQSFPFQAGGSSRTMRHCRNDEDDALRK